MSIVLNPILALICLVMFGAVSGCDEELPARNFPGKVFSGSSQAIYQINVSQNILYVNINVKNEFDETLDSIARFDGFVEIVLAGSPQYRRTLALTAAQLTYAKSYNPTTRRLILDPGDFVTFQVVWDFRTDDSLALADSVFPLAPDPGCYNTGGTEPSRKTAWVVVEISGSMSVFPQLSPAAIAKRSITFCYANRYYIIGHECPPPVCN